MSVPLPVRTKQPAEVRTIPFDFSAKLASGATLTGNPTVTPASGLTVVASSVTGATVLVQVSEGTLGQTYQVSCRINATNGDVLELDVLIRVADEN